MSKTKTYRAAYSGIETAETNYAWYFLGKTNEDGPCMRLRLRHGPEWNR